MYVSGLNMSSFVMGWCGRLLKVYFIFFFVVMNLQEWVESRSRELQTGETRKAAEKGQTANQASKSVTREGTDRETVTRPATEVPMQASPEIGEGSEVEVPLVRKKKRRLVKHGEVVPSEEAVPTRDAVPTGEAVSVEGTAQASDVLRTGEARQAPNETLRTREVPRLGGVRVVSRRERPLAIVPAERPASGRMLQATGNAVCSPRKVGKNRRGSSAD